MTELSEPEIHAEIQFEANGEQIVVPIPRSGVIIKIRHTSQETEDSLIHVKNYRLHCKEKGIHL